MQHLLHPDIPADFLDYLAEAGYRFNKTSRFIGEFTRGDITVLISHLKVVVGHYDRRRPDPITRVHEFTDIDKLDFIGWAMLLDLTGAIPLKELFNSVSRKEMSYFLQNLAQRVSWPGSGYCPTLELQEPEPAIL
jgi:hypothetical protein